MIYFKYLHKITMKALNFIKNDTYETWTHAPYGNALAGHRLNHSAKVSRYYIEY